MNGYGFPSLFDVLQRPSESAEVSEEATEKKPQKHKTRVSQVLKQRMKRSSDPREEEGPAQPPRLLRFLPHSGSFPSKHGADFPSRLLRTRQAVSRLPSPRDRAAGWTPTCLNFFWKANQQSWQGECLCTIPLLKDWKTKTAERVVQRTSLPL